MENAGVRSIFAVPKGPTATRETVKALVSALRAGDENARTPRRADERSTPATIPAPAAARGKSMRIEGLASSISTLRSVKDHQELMSVRMSFATTEKGISIPIVSTGFRSSLSCPCSCDSAASSEGAVDIRLFVPYSAVVRPPGISYPVRTKVAEASAENRSEKSRDPRSVASHVSDADLSRYPRADE
jgi:hypothetical protein